MRTDIIRGIRLGAILLAVLFAGVVGYRMLRPSPSTLSPVAISDAPAAEPSVAAAPAPAPVAVSAEVPPPPPVGSTARRSARRNAAPGGSLEKIIIVDPALAVEESPAPLPEAKAVESPKPEKLEPSPAESAAKVDSPAAQTESAAPNDGPKTDAHGKRIVKAFRRFLHIPKKDAQPDALKQP